jgi:colanic acid biosynthesis glycosyl transferase WcaI
MRILFLIPHYPPDVAAVGQIVAELVEDVVAAGHEALVVTAEPSYGSVECEEGLPRRDEASGLRLFRRETRAGAEIIWLNAPTLGRRGVWSRLVPFGAYALGAGAVTAAIGRVDLVYAMSTPPLLSGFCAMLSGALRHRPYVYNLQDVYPDIAVALGPLRKGMATRAVALVESRLRKSARVVTVLAEDMRERVLAADPGLRNIEIIPNWIDTRVVRPVAPEQNLFRKEQGLDGKFVVLYSGNLGRAHGAEMLPAVAEGLVDLRDVVLLIVGDGPARRTVEEDVARRGLRNVRFLPYQLKARLAESLSSADVSLVLQRESMTGLVVPSKLYGILASGRPAVAAVPPDCEVARVLTAHDVGVVVPPEDPARVADAVRKLYVDPAKGRQMGLRARSLAEERFDRRVITRGYIDLFERSLR